MILGLELTDFWGTVNAYRDQLTRTSRPITKPGAKLISITAGDLYVKSNYQDFQRYPEVDLAIAADAEATLPSLIEAVQAADHAPIASARSKSAARSWRADAQQLLERARTEATYGWDASPISTARLVGRALGADQERRLVAGVRPSISSAAGRCACGISTSTISSSAASGGAGVGYGAPAVGGRGAGESQARPPDVTIQNDGDLMYAPGVLWTAAHHQIPLLSVMHNNRAYHQEVMHVQRMANRHKRGVTQAAIGTTLDNPNIDYAALARSMGVYAEGPITDPKDLAPAIRRALDVVKRGEPALVDVVTQPR